MKHRSHTLISSLLAVSLALMSQSLWAQQNHAAHDQEPGPDHSGTMQHSNGNQAGGGTMQHNNGDQASGGMGAGMEGGMMMEHMQQMHANMHSGDSNSGQSAFDLIKQVVNQLEANPDTDWAKVNIDGLRQHLVDMNQVTLYAEVESSSVDGGARYVITGDGITRDAIKRMVPTHAAQIQNEFAGWSATTQIRRDGVVLTVSANDAATTAKIRALGFMGFMVLGDHHTDRHIMMATGQEHDGMSGATQSQNSGYQH